MASNRLLSRNIEKANRGPKSLGKQGSHTGVTSNVGDDRTRIFYKTKMCAFWQVGRCQRGAACKYAHGDQELNNEPDLQKTAMCPKMIRGRGCRDPQCSFAHDVHELRSRDECPKTPMGAYVEILKRCRDLDAHTEQLCSNDEVILAASDKGLRGACSDDGDLQTEFEFAVHPAFERSVTMPTAADFERTNDPGKDLRVSPAGDNDFLDFQPRPFPRTDTMGLTTSAYEGDEAKGSSQQSEQSANRSTEKEEERSDESSPEGSTVSDDSGNRHQPPSDVAEYPSTGGASVFDESHLAPRSQDLQEIYGQPEHFQVSLASPVELEAMSANELKNHIKEVGPSRSDILTASRLLHQRQPFSSGGVSIGAVTPASPSLPQGFYVDDGHFANDVKLAMRILSASTEVRELRFKLVPAKLKEPIFWTALLEILRCSKACIGTADKFDPNLLFITSAHDYGAKTGLVPPESRPEQAPPCTPSSVSSSDDHQTEAVALRRQLQQRNFEVLHLRRALEKTKAKIQSMEKEMEKKARSDSRTNASCAGPALKVHKGKWQMNRDSREFFSLDEELKANLRAEKTKRLREVSEQMKFILDADDVYGHGQWDCCGRKEYGADGCA